MKRLKLGAITGLFFAAIGFFAGLAVVIPSLGPVATFFLVCIVLGFDNLYHGVLNVPNHSTLRRVFGTDWFKYTSLTEAAEHPLLVRNLPVVIMSLCASVQILFWSGVFDPVLHTAGSFNRFAHLIGNMSFAIMVLGATISLALARSNEKKWIYGMIITYAILFCPLGITDRNQYRLSWLLTMAVKRQTLDRMAHQFENGTLPRVPLRIGFQKFNEVHVEQEKVLMLEATDTRRRLIYIPEMKHSTGYANGGYLGNGWWISENNDLWFGWDD